MKKVITNKSTHYFYEKGDKVLHTVTNKEFTVESIDVENKKIVTQEGVELELSVDVRPTDNTKINATVIDKSRKRRFRPRTVQNSRNINEGKSSFNKKPTIDKLFFAKVKDGAIVPTKIAENACYDLYACFEEEEVVIKPNEIAMIPTGIATAFDKKFKAIIYERGSTGTKGMAVRCGVIDSGYRNEWFVPINNTTNKTIVISKKVTETIKGENEVVYPYGKAIAQFALEEVPVVLPLTISYEKLEKMKSERGKGCLGSSNK